MSLLVVGAIVAIPVSESRPAAGGPLRDGVCGTWVLQQVTSVAQLKTLKPQLEAALRTPGVVGLSLRYPWNVADTDFSLLEEGLAIARGQGKAFAPRFMAGRHTPARVITAGSPYYLVNGTEKVPAPFNADGSPNTVFEAAWQDYASRLASWSRSKGVRLLHLAWYGQDWAELNHGKEVRAAPGYSESAWLNAHLRLVDLGAALSGPDLAVELPLSGYGPLTHNGLSAKLADRVTANVGAGSERFFVQANGWGPSGDWGAPDLVTEALFDAIWQKPVSRGEQAIQPQDYDWSVLYGHLYANDAAYAEVYLPSFSMDHRAQLAEEAAAFDESECTGTAPDTVSPTVSVENPTDGSTVSGQVQVDVDGSDDTGITRVDVLVDGAKVSSLDGPGSLAWVSPDVADGTHEISASAVDAAGNVGTSAPVTVVVDNVVDAAPAAPRNVQAWRYWNKTWVRWDKPLDDTGVARYRVYADAKLASETTSTSLLLSAIPTKVSVTAVNTTGKESGPATATVQIVKK